MAGYYQELHKCPHEGCKEKFDDKLKLRGHLKTCPHGRKKAKNVWEARKDRDKE